MLQRVLYLLKTYLLTMSIFIIAKVVFMLYNSSQVYSGHDILTVLWNGLSLDFSTSLYIIIVPFLVCAVSIWLGGIKTLRIIVRVYYLLIAIAMTLAFVADTVIQARLFMSSVFRNTNRGNGKCFVGLYSNTLYCNSDSILCCMVGIYSSTLENSIQQPSNNGIDSRLAMRSCYYHRNTWWFRRINHQYRTGVFLTEPVFKSLCS